MILQNNMTLTQKIQISVLKIFITLIWILEFFSLRTFFFFTNKYKKTIAITFLLLFSGYFVYLKFLPKNETVNTTNSSEVTEVLGAASPEEANPVIESSNSVFKIEEKKVLTEKPVLSAKSYLAKNLKNDETLIEKNANLILAPASTTKLMTALVALNKYDLNDELTVPSDCVTIESTKAWFPEKSKFKVIDLLYAMLVSSAGDAACTLAFGEGKYDDFIISMNNYSKKLGMKNSYFTNEVGLDGYASSHYSNANDLYILAKEAVKNDTIKEVVKTKNFVINSLDGNFTYSAQNTNLLLWEVEGSVGIKTGTTVAAGEVLIYEYKKDSADVIIIVMGSADRFNDTKKILNWILENYNSF